MVNKRLKTGALEAVRVLEMFLTNGIAEKIISRVAANVEVIPGFHRCRDWREGAGAFKVPVIIIC
jgi:hypothetical protein